MNIPFKKGFVTLLKKTEHFVENRLSFRPAAFHHCSKQGWLFLEYFFPLLRKVGIVN
jgi:hypothetical protein